MELINFITWFLVITGVLGFSLGVMIWAYNGSGSRAILFTEPVPLSNIDTESESDRYFQQGYEAYKAGKYRDSINKFSQAIKAVSDLAEAYHNLGLAYANLRQDNEAAYYLARAADCYAIEGKDAQIAQVKENLTALKNRAISS